MPSLLCWRRRAVCSRIRISWMSWYWILTWLCLPRSTTWTPTWNSFSFIDTNSVSHIPPSSLKHHMEKLLAPQSGPLQINDDLVKKFVAEFKEDASLAIAFFRKQLVQRILQVVPRLQSASSASLSFGGGGKRWLQVTWWFVSSEAQEKSFFSVSDPFCFWLVSSQREAWFLQIQIMSLDCTCGQLPGPAAVSVEEQASGSLGSRGAQSGVLHPILDTPSISQGSHYCTPESQSSISIKGRALQAKIWAFFNKGEVKLAPSSPDF